MSFPLSEAAERNKGPILEVLRSRLPASGGRLLEIASGTGQHSEHFAQALPQWHFVPSDIAPEGRQMVDARLRGAGLSNVSDAIDLDVTTASLDERFEVVYCANMIHIAPPAASEGLFRVAGACLSPGGLLFTYGPYRFDGKHTSESNVAFEGWLKAKDPSFGVRDIEWLDELAAGVGLSREETLTMPANNFVLVWRRAAG